MWLARMLVLSAALAGSVRAEQPAANRAQVYLNHRINLGGVRIGPGHFELAILENDNGLDQLSLEDLSLFCRRRSLVVTAHVVPTDDASRDVVVVYGRSRDGALTIREVRFPLRKVIPIE